MTYDAIKADRKQQRAAERKAKAEQMKAAINVGTILVASWGYEQTNIDFYIVTAKSKSGATVTIQRIGSTTVESTGAMSSIVRANPAATIGDAIVGKRIGAYGITMNSYSSAHPCAADATFHASWCH